MGSLRGIFGSLGLAALAAGAGPASASPPCEKLYAKLSFSDDEITRGFVRRPGGALDPVYRANMLRVTEAFDQALARKEAPADFAAWFAEQHRLAVIGEAPGSFYWPEVNTLRDGREVPSNLATAETAAGIYRHLRRDQPAATYLTQEVKLGAETLAEIAERTKDRAAQTVMVGPGIPFSYHFPMVDGIPAEALPRYTVNKGAGNVKFDYPAAKFVPDYVAEMKASFGRLRTGLAAPVVNRDAVLGELARYYHLAMIGHPFMRVNNSLVMAEVNVVLKRLGMKPVAHGDLDYVVRSLDSDGARAAFLDFVRRGQ